MASLVLLLIVALFLFQQWRAYKYLQSIKEVSLMRRVFFRAEVFAHNYRMWQRVYREILMTGGRKNVDY